MFLSVEKLLKRCGGFFIERIILVEMENVIWKCVGVWISESVCVRMQKKKIFCGQKLCRCELWRWSGIRFIFLRDPRFKIDCKKIREEKDKNVERLSKTFYGLTLR